MTHHGKSKEDLIAEIGLRERQVLYLWDLLDRIDGASDAFKTNYEGLAGYAYDTDKLRHNVGRSDGYTVTLTDFDPAKESKA